MVSGRSDRSRWLAGAREAMEDLHEQTGLSAGTVADNDELATDLGHGVWFVGSGSGREADGWRVWGWWWVLRGVEVKSAGAVMEKADAPASGRVVSARS